MASSMQSFPRMLKMLRENSNVKEKREALTYIRSNTKKLESSNAIKEEQYKELCKLVLDAFANGNSDIQNEAYETLNVIIKDFKNHSLNLFEAMSQINRKHRLKILKLLEVVDDNAITTIAHDASAINFFNDCVHTVEPSLMTWITSTTCTDDIQALIEAENRPLSDDQKLEEETINYTLTLLRRLYKVAAVTSDDKIERFDTLLMDKVMVLAYMGHKRQRGTALKLLQQALATNILTHVRSQLTEVWTQYKSTLQSAYCKRMLLLVSACELDWATQWNISIQYLGVDLHRGAGLINNLLSVEEKAFKSTDTIIRRQAFLSWKLLVDNFALDPQELATARRIKLLCIPLNAKNSKTELIALTKLEVWWHVIIKLYKDISKFVNPVITQFLNFCFGPLGDTPLLSSKFDVVASPGKRFFKTKVVAIDALLQLLVMKQENHTVFSPILEERLPHSMSDAVFQECYKSVIHSVGEALLILSQLTDAEMKNRYQFGKVLWINLINYVQESKMKTKEPMYKDLVLVITELTNYVVDKPMIKDLIFDAILFEMADLSKNFKFQDDKLSDLVLKLLHISILNEAEKNHYNALKRLLWKCVKPGEGDEYSPNALKVLKDMFKKLQSLPSTRPSNIVVLFELWCLLAEILTKFISDLQEINEGNAVEHNFQTMETIMMFPFTSLFLQDQKQSQELANAWKTLYTQYESRANLISTVKPNEVLLKTASAMQSCLAKRKECYCLMINCLDALLNTVNYKYLLACNDVPSILQLIVDLLTYSLSDGKISECETALKALSTMLLTVYGHDSQKVMMYLQVCKPAIEIIIGSKLQPLFKEAGNAWETIVSIFKGLDKSISYDLLSSYKKVIIQALNHSNPCIESGALSVLEMRNALSSSAKDVLEEIAKQAKNDETVNNSIITRRKKDQIEKISKSIKMADSIANNNSTIFKRTEKDKEAAIPDSDSQDYVFIKTDFKFDVNRLTEHQKESLKRKREDIPALYNDLSQSSSQDTQNLQEWFDRKNKLLEETNERNDKRGGSDSILDDDANKENKIETAGVEITSKSTDNEAKADENTERSETVELLDVPATNFNQLFEEDQSQSIEKKERCESPENNLLENKVPDITPESVEYSEEDLPIAKRLSSEFRREGPEETSSERESSPSVLDNGKRRNRNSAKVNVSSKLEEAPSNEEEEANDGDGGHRMLRTKAIQGKPNKQKAGEITREKPLEEEKRGVKRKSTSDSEAEGSLRRRRKLMLSSEISSDNDSVKSVDSDSGVSHTTRDGDGGNLSQRTKKEISRLRINMVFNSPLLNRRRSKTSEDNKEGSRKKTHSPESKGIKSKVGDGKTGDPAKKVTKSVEKEGKVLTGQSVITRRSKRSTKQEGERSESNESGTLKSYLQSKDEKVKQAHNVKSLQPTSSDGIQSDSLMDEEKSKSAASKADVSNDVIHEQEVESKEEDFEDQPAAVSEEKSEAQDEDIIENSQDPGKLERKYNEKQCFIKINKIEDVTRAKSQECTMEDNEVAEIISSERIDEKDSKNDEDLKEISKIGKDVSVELSQDVKNNHCEDEKDIAPEIQKLCDSPSSIKSYLLGFSSPKGGAKRFSRMKTYSAQGRAAHMLGLVTKQGRMETDCQAITLDDDVANKKVKGKDADGETSVGKKERLPALKDVEKITGACSTRQEKIFNNMRSTDYCSSPPIKLFSNLKNDGEKISPRAEKSTDYISVQIDNQAESTSETLASPTPEKDELPILEWSSANPPSLTASPSASILKRHRQAVPEPEPESMTPNKRKRVSFADPPVSKEMGYEIANNESPHKLNKFSSSRGLLVRKDSPLRLKQSRTKSMQNDLDKCEKEEEDVHSGITTDIDLQCEKENELLTKIAEELEYSENMVMDIDAQTTYHLKEHETTDDCIVKADAFNKLTIDNLSMEIEVTQNLIPSKNTEQMYASRKCQNETAGILEFGEGSSSGLENEHEDSETQEDIFGGTNSNRNNPQAVEGGSRELNNLENRGQSKSLQSLTFNTTNDSVVDHSTEVHSENLEDTVDVGNMTSLNSTANFDDIFCEKLMRTSTQATDSAEEEDTLPVTDSVFGSLPLSQKSENLSEYNVEMPHPELLDSTQPIYPTLLLCREPVTSIVDQLTNPLWLQHLCTYFASRGVQTVGDLARLPEREVNRIPVKSNSKISFVKSVLKSFEKTHCTAASTSLEVHNITKSDESCLINSIVSSEGDAIPLGQSLRLKAQGETLNHITLLAQCSGAKVLHNTNSRKDFGNSCNEIDRKSSHLSTLEEASPGAFTLEEFAGTAAANSFNATTSPSKSPGTINTSSHAVGDSSEVSVANASYIAHSTKTVGTCTTSDSIYPVKTSRTATKSVAAQMALEDLLDEIDVNLVLESAVRRCSPEKIFLQYKNKMRHIPQAELEKETIKMLGNENRKTYNEVTLKAACRACGVNKVLLRLPDIFSADKQFFVKVLNAYRKKIKTSDCLNILDFAEVKDAICEKCTSSDLAEMLSIKLKEEEQKGIRKPMTELSSLNAMLKRMPMDVIISHTVANDELIPSRVVLDIALQNNSPSDIAHALESQSPLVTKSVFNKLWSSRFAAECIEKANESKEGLFNVFKAISSKLSTQDLVQVYYECMKDKLQAEEEKE